MADTVVDFINTTKQYTDFVTGVTLVSNSASEQAVVKDIQLSNPSNQTFKYTVGNVEVANSNSSKLTGSELVGASKSLVMSLSGIPVANQIFAATSSTTYYPNAIKTFFDTSIPASVTSDTSANFSFSTSLSTTPYFICFGANGDFYYSNNNASSLYRRAGGVNGTETIVMSGGMACATSFDGRYIYGFWVNTNGMNVYDTQTNTQLTSGSINGFSGTITNQSSSAALDGYVVLKWDGSSGGSMHVINGATRTSNYNWITSGTQGQRNNMAMGKNSVGNYYILRGDTSQLRVIGLGNSLASPNATLTASYTNPTGWSLGDPTNPNVYLRNPSAPRFIFSAGGSSPAGYIDLESFVDNPTGSLGTITINNIIVATSYAMTLRVDSTKAVADFGTVGVRATGIKTT
jgi:hypothetical protein